MKGFQKIGLERIYRLFELAEQEFSRHPERSRRYVELARKIGTKNKVKVPNELRKSFCKKCGSFLKQGTNSSLGKEGSLLTLACKECGFVRKMRDVDGSATLENKRFKEV